MAQFERDREREFPPQHRLETISRRGLTVKLIDTRPLNGNHNGTFISDPGLGAHHDSQDTKELRYRLNLHDFGAVDWFESPWGNRLGPLGQDSGHENERALRCHDLVLDEIEERLQQEGSPLEIHGIGWSRGAAIAAAGAGRDPERIKTLTLVCPGFMKDTSWAAAKRYFAGRASDVLKGVRNKGITHLRDFAPFLKAGFSNAHRMIHRGGATAGWAPIPEMFTTSLAGVPITVIQGRDDETFPPNIVRNNIEQGYIELYDALLANEGKTVFDTTLEEIMPNFIEVPGGHGIGKPDEAAEIIIKGVEKMNISRLAK